MREYPNTSVSPVTKKFYPDILLKGQKQRCALRSVLMNKMSNNSKKAYQSMQRFRQNSGDKHEISKPSKQKLKPKLTNKGTHPPLTF